MPLDDNEPDDAEQDDAGEELVDEETQALVQRLAQEALDYNDEYLRPDREEATRYYQGKPFGNEKAGKSQFVVPEVRDKILQIMPAMMRVFAGGERVVKVEGRNAEDDACALQKTDYANYIFTVDNPGFLLLYNWLKDGFKHRLGIVKAWWQDKDEIEQSEHTGLSEEQVQQLAADDSVTKIDTTQEQPAGPDQPPTFSAKVTRTVKGGRVMIRGVPGSEFLYSPNASDLELDATLVGQVKDMRRSELVAMGYDADELADYDSFGALTEKGTEEQDRRIEGPRATEEGAEEDLDPLIAYGELYVRTPNEDGIAVLKKFCTLGTQFEIARQEAASFTPFAYFIPDPEPHEVQGLSLADYTRDIQRAKSDVTRALFDGLALATDADLEVDESNVQMKDVTAPDRPRIIRVRKMGSVREIKYTFPAEGLQVLAMLDQLSESRTGSPKPNAELSANVLQSTTKEGVAATVTGSRERQELFARMFAETSLVTLFRKILRLVIQHQNRPRVVRLRNAYVEVDPRDWDSTLDMKVDVGLGTGVFEDKMALLLQIAAKQEQIFQLLGPGNPLVSLVQYRNTLAKVVEMTGFRDASEFFLPITQEQEQQALQSMAEAKKGEASPSPEAMLAQVQMKQIEAEIALRQQEMQLKVAEMQQKREKDAAELQLKRRQIDLDDDRERDKSAAELQLKKVELEMKHQREIVDAQLRAATEQTRNTTLAEPANE